MIDDFRGKRRVSEREAWGLNLEWRIKNYELKIKNYGQQPETFDLWLVTCIRSLKRNGKE